MRNPIEGFKWKLPVQRLGPGIWCWRHLRGEGQIGRPDVVASYLGRPESSYLCPDDRLGWQTSGFLNKTAKLGPKAAFLKLLVKAMADAGVELVAGTGAPTVPGMLPGFSLHDALSELEASGLSCFQALSAATRAPGAFIHRTKGGDPFGIVAPGYRADLILSESNPLAMLSTLRAPVGVMVKDTGGTLPPSKLSQTRFVKAIGARAKCHDRDPSTKGCWILLNKPTPGPEVNHPSMHRTRYYSNRSSVPKERKGDRCAAQGCDKDQEVERLTFSRGRRDEHSVSFIHRGHHLQLFAVAIGSQISMSPCPARGSNPGPYLSMKSGMPVGATPAEGSQLR